MKVMRKKYWNKKFGAQPVADAPRDTEIEISEYESLRGKRGLEDRCVAALAAPSQHKSPDRLTRCCLAAQFKRGVAWLLTRRGNKLVSLRYIVDAGSRALILKFDKNERLIPPGTKIKLLAPRGKMRLGGDKRWRTSARPGASAHAKPHLPKRRIVFADADA